MKDSFLEYREEDTEEVKVMRKGSVAQSGEGIRLRSTLLLLLKRPNYFSKDMSY